MPSMSPTTKTLVPSTVTMNSGSRLWISSDEMSISIDTKPSIHTLAGIARQPDRRCLSGGSGTESAGKVESRDQGTHLRTHAGERLQTETARDELDGRRRIVGGVVHIARAG